MFFCQCPHIHSNLVYLLKYDTVHGKFNKSIESNQDNITVDGKNTKIYSERDPSKLPWKELDVDCVIESTGLFTKKEDSSKHLRAGAKKVLISAPSKDSTPMFVMGVNHDKYNKDDKIVSTASCTTNCLGPIVKVLLDNFGIEEGLMSTVHAYTSTQAVVDGPSKKDFRGGRCSSYNIIPSSTGAAKALGKCIPELDGKLTGISFRVPVADVSVVDLTVKLSKSTTYEDICLKMKEAANSNLKGILEYTDDYVVSSDFIGCKASSIFDALGGLGLNDKFYKIVSWYDNEMGYSNRIIDFIEYMFKK